MNPILLSILAFLIFNLNTLASIRNPDFKALFKRIFPIQIGFLLFLCFGFEAIENLYVLDPSNPSNHLATLLLITLCSLCWQVILWIKRKEDSIFLLNLFLFSVSWLAFLGIFSPLLIFLFFCIFCLLKLIFYFSIYQLFFFLLFGICLALSFFDFSSLYLFSYLPLVSVFLNFIMLSLRFKL